MEQRIEYYANINTFIFKDKIDKLAISLLKGSLNITSSMRDNLKIKVSGTVGSKEIERHIVFENGSLLLDLDKVDVSLNNIILDIEIPEKKYRSLSINGRDIEINADVKNVSFDSLRLSSETKDINFRQEYGYYEALNKAEISSKKGNVSFWIEGIKDGLFLYDLCKISSDEGNVYCNIDANRVDVLAKNIFYNGSFNNLHIFSLDGDVEIMSEVHTDAAIWLTGKINNLSLSFDKFNDDIKIPARLAIEDNELRIASHAMINNVSVKEYDPNNMYHYFDFDDDLDED